MDNLRNPDSQHRDLFPEHRDLPTGAALPHPTEREERLRSELHGQENSGALPELTDEVERLLCALQEQEVDVDRHTLQRVLEYARKA